MNLDQAKAVLSSTVANVMTGERIPHVGDPKLGELEQSIVYALRDADDEDLLNITAHLGRTSVTVLQTMLRAQVRHAQTMATAETATSQQHAARKVFEATSASALDLIAKGCPPAAVVAGLLGVITIVGGKHVEARELRKFLMQTADCISD